MENYSTKSINCCFCDKDLSPDHQNKLKSPIKYRCPSCERLYCQPDCFSGHKEKFSCSGVRNKTPYIHLSKFDQQHFLDDYFFLEGISNKLENSHRILPELKPTSTSGSKNNTSLNKTNKNRFNRKNWRNRKNTKAQKAIVTKCELTK